MYKKKNNKPVIITIVVVVIVIAAILGANIFARTREQEKERDMETETEAEAYDILMYKTSGAVVEFEEAWLKSDSETEAVLRVKKDTLVTLFVTPKQGQYLESVDIVDYDFNEINNFLRETEAETIRVNFVMPDTDIIINFNLMDVEYETEASEQETEQPESETETEGAPYGLTLHGVTADIITSYNGQFDDRVLLQQLGDALHIDSPRSDYYGVTDVTFSTEKYTGEKESDKVYYYLYFDENPQKKILSTYFLKERAYVFTEPAEAQNETEITTAPNTDVSTSAGNGGNGSATGYSSGTSGTSTTITTSFDIMQVSTTFLAYTGDNDTFYDKTFEYVLSKGLTGTIVGTMSSYEIYPEEKKASFKITLSIGGSITGTYNKADNSYSFSGL